MEAYNFFINKAGRLRSGWRLGIFVVTFAIIATLLEFGLVILLTFGFGFEVGQALGGYPGHVAQALILFTAAAVTGWACGGLIEGLPMRALGWAICCSILARAKDATTHTAGTSTWPQQAIAHHPERLRSVDTEWIIPEVKTLTL